MVVTGKRLAAQPVEWHQSERLGGLGRKLGRITTLREIALGAGKQRLEARAGGALLHLEHGQVVIRRERLRRQPVKRMPPTLSGGVSNEASSLSVDIRSRSIVGHRSQMPAVRLLPIRRMRY